MDCIFCGLDRAILVETKLSLAFFDGFPVSKGHALVVPKRHVATIWDLSTDEYVDVFSLEPISKSSEEDHEAGELYKAEEVLSVVLPADEDATLPLYPGEEPLDEPSPRVTA